MRRITNNTKGLYKKSQNKMVSFYYWNTADYLAADVLTPENATGSMDMVAGSGNQYWGSGFRHRRQGSCRDLLRCLRAGRRDLHHRYSGIQPGEVLCQAGRRHHRAAGPVRCHRSVRLLCEGILCQHLIEIIRRNRPFRKRNGRFRRRYEI